MSKIHLHITYRPKEKVFVLEAVHGADRVQLAAEPIEADIVAIARKISADCGVPIG